MSKTAVLTNGGSAKLALSEPKLAGHCVLHLPGMVHHTTCAVLLVEAQPC
jgi:hypothetical protein